MQKCLDVLFPSYCEGCGRIGERLCASCSQTLDYWHGHDLVYRADMPSAVSIFPPLISYKKAKLAAQLIHAFKYQGQQSVGRSLAVAHAHILSKMNEICKYTAIVEVPMHWLRLSRRGFNQSTVLAQVLSKELQIPHLLQVIRRKRYTKRQVNLQMTARKQNMRQAFAISRPYLIKDKHILLVDDVLTTGATTFACAEVLLQAGAAGVGICALALRDDQKAPK